MRDRLIELIQQKQECGWRYTDDEYTTDVFNFELADYLLANGVIVPPCKVGDVVYTNIKGIGLQNSFRINSVDLLGFSNGIYSWTWHQLGKSVFLTLEEAERALKGGVQE
jgi:hypothetical protein